MIHVCEALAWLASGSDVTNMSSFSAKASALLDELVDAVVWLAPARQEIIPSIVAHEDSFPLWDPYYTRKTRRVAKVARIRSIRRIETFSHSWELTEALGVALNPRTTTEMLDLVSRVDSTSLQEVLAGDPRLSMKTVRKLSASWHWDVRAELARRDDLPRDVQSHLANDRDARVREALGMNPSVDEDLRVIAALSPVDFVGAWPSRSIGR